MCPTGGQSLLVWQVLLLGAQTNLVIVWKQMFMCSGQSESVLQFIRGYVGLLSVVSLPLVDVVMVEEDEETVVEVVDSLVELEPELLALGCAVEELLEWVLPDVVEEPGTESDKEC